jgi:hypothetical protein
MLAEVPVSNEREARTHHLIRAFLTYWRYFQLPGGEAPLRSPHLMVRPAGEEPRLGIPLIGGQIRAECITRASQRRYRECAKPRYASEDSALIIRRHPFLSQLLKASLAASTAIVWSLSIPMFSGIPPTQDLAGQVRTPCFVLCPSRASQVTSSPHWGITRQLAHLRSNVLLCGACNLCTLRSR